MKTLEKAKTRTRSTVTISRAEYEELKSRNEWILEQLRLANKKRFGVSSEKLQEELIGQLSLTFNEAEAYAAPPGTKATLVAAHTRHKRSNRLVEEVLPENVPAEIVEHKLSEAERGCPMETLAYIMVQKFCMSVPLYRQEQEWARQGVRLSRQTMSSWVLRAVEDWLKPVYEELCRLLI